MTSRVMRVIVFFDLPVKTAEGNRAYLNFRKFLINDGFFMMQESVYCKLAINGTSANALQEHIKRNSPPTGLIQVLTVTEKQYSNMLYLGGTSKKTDIVDSSDRFIVI